MENEEKNTKLTSEEEVIVESAEIEETVTQENIEQEDENTSNVEVDLSKDDIPESDVEIITSEEVKNDPVLKEDQEQNKVDRGVGEGVYNAEMRRQVNLGKLNFESIETNVELENSTLYNNFAKEKEKFDKEFTKYNRFGLAIKLVGLALLLTVLAVVASLSGKAKSNTIMWTVTGVCVALMIGLFVVGKILGTKKTNIITDYQSKWAHFMASSAYGNQEGIEDPKIALTGKVKDEDVIASHYHAVINNIESRFRIEATYLGKSYSDCEVSVIIPNTIKRVVKTPSVLSEDYKVEENKEEEIVLTPEGEEQEATSESQKENVVEEQKEEQNVKEEKLVNTDNKLINGFFGKFISYDLQLNSDEGIIIVISSANTLQPTNLKNYELFNIEDLNENIYVYATSESFASELLTVDIKNILNSFKVDDELYDMFISMNSAGTHIGLNYSDNVMSLPATSKVVIPSEQQLNTYRRDVTKILEFLKKVQE